MHRSVRYTTLAIGMFAGLMSCVSDRPTSPKLSGLTAAPGDRIANITVPQVVISQVYGGGGNAGAVLKNDFIELFNPGTSAVSLAGWSVQYASSTGTSWQVTNLSGTIPAGGYYLVQEAAGTGGTVNLPIPDATGSGSGIPMAAGAGKVWLVASTVALSGTCPTGDVDHVSYGTAASNCGGLGTTATLANTTAAIRNDAGCAYTGVLSTDFAVSAPAPRNSNTVVHPCQVQPPQPQPASVTVDPAEATAFVSGTRAFTATALDAAGNPVVTTFTWSSDNASATVSSSGVATGVAQGTATITATAANGVAGSATLHVALPPPPPAVRFSEIHYDNTGVDVGEAIEVEGPAGTDLSGWSVVLYNGDGGAAYGTRELDGAIAPRCEGRGIMVLDYPTNGVQNGSPDGLALVNGDGQVVEFLSYEGSFTASDGPAAGMSSVDIGAVEPGTTAVGLSLQRTPNGVWPTDGPLAHPPNSFGRCNTEGPAPPAPGISFSGRAPTDLPLPVGFESQIFATERNGATGAEVTTTFTWVSETPAIASVDIRGVIRALAPGTATFRATAEDGITATYSLPMTVASASTTALYANNTEFGDPIDSDASDDFIIRRPQYALSYSKSRNTPNWVAYEIDATHLGAIDRCNCFTHDPDLPADFTHLTTADYTGAGAFAGFGIDRGHMTRSFDRTTGTLDNAVTFYLSNVVPQTADLNQGPWANMENELGDLARVSDKEVYVVTGPAGNNGTVKGEGKIVIPTSTWKVAVIMPRDKGLGDVHTYQDLEVIAVIMPNVPGIRNVPWRTYETTVDAVEALSGYDLLALLPDNVERAVEGNIQPPIAKLAMPSAAAEGSAVTMSAAASLDPNGSIASYAWSFGDGATASGPDVAHTYAQNGSYDVRLVVTDNDGLTDEVGKTIQVQNVAPSQPSFNGARLVLGDVYTATGSFTDPGADSWSATIDYGDRSGIVTQTLAGPGFSLSHAYATHGSFTVTVTVFDGEATSTSTRTVIVLAPPAAAIAAPAAASEGAPVTLSGTTSTDADGSITQYAWTLGDGSTASGNTVSHAYAQDGTYTVTLTVTDNDLLSSVTTASVHVMNAAPVITSVGGATSAVSGLPLSLSATFADPGVHDSPWDWSIAWGEGSPTVGRALLQTETASGSHSYLRAGTYTVTVAVKDKDGGVGSRDIAVEISRLVVSGQIDADGFRRRGQSDATGAFTVLSTASFDATSIVAGSARIGTVGVAKNKKGELLTKAKDENHDRRLDLDLEFSVKGLIDAGELSLATRELVLTADLTDGRQIMVRASLRPDVAGR